MGSRNIHEVLKRNTTVFMVVTGPTILFLLETTNKRLDDVFCSQRAQTRVTLTGSQVGLSGTPAVTHVKAW